MKKRILVTGGMGYIGSHTVVELISAGYEVVIVDNLYNSNISVLESLKSLTGKDIPFERVDCLDLKAMRNVCAKYSFSAVIHFAAYKAVGESVKKPLEYYNNNLNTLINILTVCREYGIGNIVFSSSCTVYGQPDILPATELTPKKVALSPYGKSKQMCEDILEDMAHADPNLKVIALRYFNPIGAHPSALLGEVPNGVPNNLLPYVTQTAMGIREYLSIYGNDYNTPDGSAVRDYIDVVDLATAHVKATNRMTDNLCKNQIEFFNIGTGVGVSVLELVSAFERANNLKLNYRIADRREGDIEAVWGDTSLAASELGWRAKVSLEETLQNAWKWENRRKK